MESHILEMNNVTFISQVLKIGDTEVLGMDGGKVSFIFLRLGIYTFRSLRFDSMAFFFLKEVLSIFVRRLHVSCSPSGVGFDVEIENS